MSMYEEIVELEEGWEHIKKGIEKLQRILEGETEAQFSIEEYMSHYTTIYSMCTQKRPPDYSAQLYAKYKDAFVEYISSRVLPSLREKHDEFLLREFVKRWSNHKVMVRWLSGFFHYLDRYFVFKRGLSSLNEVGVTCFKDLVYDEVKVKVKDVVLLLVHNEREGVQVDRALLNNVINIVVEIGMGKIMYYENDFEQALLGGSTCYYSRKASYWIENYSCPEYMLMAEDCLRKEKDRIDQYLHSNSEIKLLEKVKHELLVVYTSQLLEKKNSGCLVLLRDDKVEDLSRMYRLYHKIPEALDLVTNMFKQHVKAKGLVQLTDDDASSKAETGGGSQEHVFVTKLIELHDKHMGYVTGCFSNNILFHKALKEAFDFFCNKFVAGSSSAELLASYCDNILKKGSNEKLSNKAIEETLDKVVQLLANISDKDLFVEFHRKRLSRRLLFGKSGSDDHERIILTKLKQQWGGQLTSKMEGMFKDMTLTKENQNHFEEYLSNNPAASPGIDLKVTVLNTGYWPTYKSSDINLPKEMVKCVEAFKEFYGTQTKKRKLTWIYSLGTCNISGKFEPKTIELMVSTFQAAVLLLFNASDRLSYSEIKTQLNLSDVDLVRSLQPLSCDKYKILIKEPTNNTVTSSDYFSFNPKFTDRLRRVKVPLPLVDERKKAVKVVDKDRRYAIDAAIVRIMKSRKILHHRQLMNECIEQLSLAFKPEIRMIKGRIEDLITRDYLERDPETKDVYRYLA